jgi:hypothetical protein
MSTLPFRTLRSSDEQGDPAINEWLDLPNGHRFFVTVAYLQGAYAAQQNQPLRPPMPHGAAFAQYTYGYHNERKGYHDNIDLPPIPDSVK